MDGLPTGSPHRSTYAEPAGADGSYLLAAGLALVGLYALVSGEILAGLVALAAGGGWGFVIHKKAEASDHARAAWANRRICLACTEQWVP
ncbi:hypothetical protein ADK57_25995 [Streptomyces sp. MMG1533]|uniref:hypothetical protein n=1 Tax=Streptomyces sp. MMG1533 TaxID=1415546 RepID=UPI0006AF1E79|nr:hypothetical protein [Streptomyces sp. MMG1533]KOU62086.1 hypothetical protein ADK57_25995 [Streptomyces sp. MMG1533]